MKVMICNDDTSKVKVLKDLLNGYKFKLITITQGSDFFKQVQNHKPSVIIVNESFANKSAGDLLKKIRTNPMTSQTGVIFIRDEKDFEDMNEEIISDSMVEWIREPFKIKNLRHYVDRWTTLRSLHVRQ